jgi:DNA uptake protein ComE-like DNA-binding protein
LLSIVVIGLLHTSTIDLMVVKNYGDRIQAHYLAVAGLEKAKALLYRDARERSRTAKSHSAELFNSPADFREVALGRGQFSVLRRGNQDEGGGLLFGVSDEESRLNVNYASAEQLAKLEGMTPDVAAAIIDWRDEDNEVTPGGAEAEYYTSLQPPRLPRNGPLQTIRELLMVRGVTPELLLGADRRQNGLLDPEGQSEPAKSAAGLDVGWAGLLTVDSSVDNVSAAGQERVNVQSADENTLAGVRGITADMAKAIVAYRGQNQLQSIADLLEVRAVQNQNQPASRADANPNPGEQNPPAPDGAPANQPAANASGPRVISPDLLMDIADEITTDSKRELPGLVNLNTAGLEVLICLPNITRQLAQSIISYRQSSGFFPNTACLLKVPGMTTDLFKQLAPLVTARSETFRILSEGRVTSTGARQRIQEIVHVGLHAVTTVSYREDDL